MNLNIRCLLPVGLVACMLLPADSLAQETYYTIRPALLGEGKVTPGARWEAGIEPGQSVHLALSFPRAWWWGLRMQGAVAGLPRLNPEPLMNGNVELGVQILLLKQRPCLPDDCMDLVDFDLGYAVLGFRGTTAWDQQIEEGIAGAGGFLMYRPLGLQNGFWPLVPTFSVEYSFNRPVRSFMRDALDLEARVYRNLQAELIWHILFAHDWVPRGLQPGRLDITVHAFRSFGLDADLENITGSSGRYLAADLGYDLTSQVPWIRHIFLRGSHGRHQVHPDNRRTWMIGIVIGKTR